MGGAPWIAHEGYLQVRRQGDDDAGATTAASSSPLARLKPSAKPLERYFVLYLGRKFEVYANSSKEQRVDGGYLRGFGGWDGGGTLRASEAAYGLELHVEKSAHARLFVTAFNRVDLEKWCRGFTAVLDPESPPGQEVRRARRKARKEEKRLLEEKKARYLLYKEQQRKMVLDEQQRLLAREEEIQNMTPLERVDGLGSLDDATARLLEKRKQRLQRRAAPTAGRANKIAIRRRMEEAAGGKLENVAPLRTKVVEQRAKVRVEVPAPGQFIEAPRNGRRHSSPAHPKPVETRDSDSESSSISSGSRSRSGSYVSSTHSGPVPRDYRSVSSGDTSPPPPPPPTAPSHQGSMRRDSSAKSIVRSSSRRVSGVDNDKTSMQHALAAILNGRSVPVAASNDVGYNRHSESTGSVSNSIVDDSAGRRSIPSSASAFSSTAFSSTDEHAAAEPSMAKALAASLAAVRRERVDGGDQAVETPRASEIARDRQRRLSNEGRSMFKAAVQSEPSKPQKPRKGLFESSDEDEDEDSDDSEAGGLFGVTKTDAQRQTRGHPNGVPAANPVAVSLADQWGVTDTKNRSSTTSSHSSSPPRQATGQEPTAQLAPTVTLKSYSVKVENKKSTAVYTFVIQALGSEFTFSHSYHEFEDIHARLGGHISVDVLPKFPSKHLFSSSIKPEFLQKRADEFLHYLQALVAIPSIFGNERFRTEFAISEPRAQESLRAAPVQDTKSSALRSFEKKTRDSSVQNLFGSEEDSDSDADSSPVASKRQTAAKPSVPDIPPQPVVRAEGKRHEKHKRSHDRSAVSSRRRSSSGATHTKAPSKPVASSEPQPSTPSSDAKPIKNITGLPARPNPFGGGRGDLMAAIRMGAQLKAVDPDAPKPAPSAASSTALRPGLSSQPSMSTTAPSTSISDAISNAMAARRIHIEYEDPSDDDSDDDWD